MKISTGAIGDNARTIRASLPENVRMMCVVKANAYGHDSVPVARQLLSAGADAFAVAIVEEARDLRAAGIECPILILGGAGEASLREAVRLGVSQAVYDVQMLDVLQDEAEKCGRRALAHLKLDTGMSRIGVRGMDALEGILAHWKRCPNVEMEGFFTHFCVADTDLDYTGRQNAEFEAGLKRCGGHRTPMTHGGGPVHRQAGSMGPTSSPSRIFKGHNGAGQMGVEQVTVENLDIVKVDEELNMIVVRGAIPGPKGGIVYLKNTVKNFKAKGAAANASINPQKASARTNPQKASARNR